MTLGNRRWSVVILAVAGQLGLGAMDIKINAGAHVGEIVFSIALTVGGYCGFDAVGKKARAEAGVTEAQAVELERAQK